MIYGESLFDRLLATSFTSLNIYHMIAGKRGIQITQVSMTVFFVVDILYDTLFLIAPTLFQT